MTNSNPKGKALTIKKTFSRETKISLEIYSEKSIIWNLLTNGQDFSRWNSTIVSIDGDIKLNNTIFLKSSIDSKRKFKLKVKEYNENKKLVWGDSMGTRTYKLESINDNLTIFSMNEKIGGLFFPIFAKLIPSFDQSFEKFANDLKVESEIISKSK